MGVSIIGGAAYVMGGAAYVIVRAVRDEVHAGRVGRGVLVGVVEVAEAEVVERGVLFGVLERGESGEVLGERGESGEVLGERGDGERAVERGRFVSFWWKSSGS